MIAASGAFLGGGIVSMPAGRAVFRETQGRDGVAYELVVYSTGGGLYGAFTCPVCELTEVNPLLSGTQAEAITRTLAAIESHHAAHHTSA